jgi:hypothetical protein
MSSNFIEKKFFLERFREKFPYLNKFDERNVLEAAWWSYDIAKNFFGTMKDRGGGHDDILVLFCAGTGIVVSLENEKARAIKNSLAQSLSLAFQENNHAYVWDRILNFERVATNAFINLFNVTWACSCEISEKEFESDINLELFSFVEELTGEILDNPKNFLPQIGNLSNSKRCHPRTISSNKKIQKKFDFSKESVV